MFAVLRTGGKQYKVAPGDLVQVEKLDADVGARLNLADVLLVHDTSGALKVGAPYVKGAAVNVTVVAQERTRSLIVFKKKRRQNYRRKNHHRQFYTVLKVEDIVLGE